MILQAFLALGLAVVVLGDGCCTPPKWQGMVAVAGGYTTRKGRRGSTEGLYQMAYNSKAKKIAVSGTYRKREADATLKQDGTDEGMKYKIIYDYSKKQGYFIFLSKKKCKTFDLKKKFEPFCIPEKAKKLGSTYFGFGNNTLDITSYAVAYKKGRSSVGSYISVTDGCVPVTEDIAGSVKGTGFFSNVNYVGISGIKDPKVFTPPKYCKGEPMDLLDETLVGSNLHTQFALFQTGLPAFTEN